MNKLIVYSFLVQIIFPSASYSFTWTGAAKICSKVIIEGVSWNFVYDYLKSETGIFSQDEARSFQVYHDKLSRFDGKCLADEEIHGVKNDTVEIKKMLLRINDRIDGNNEMIKKILSELHRLSGNLNGESQPLQDMRHREARIVNLTPTHRKKKIRTISRTASYDAADYSDAAQLNNFIPPQPQHILFSPNILPPPPPIHHPIPPPPIPPPSHYPLPPPPPPYPPPPPIR